MANVCNYHIKVKGTAKNCYAFMCSTNTCSGKWIEYEEGTEKNYTLRYSGDCKWDIDSYTHYGTADISTMPENTLDMTQWCFDNRINELDLVSRSELFNVEVWCCTMLESGCYDDDFESYHYKNGEERSIRRMPAELKFHNIEEV